MSQNSPTLLPSRETGASPSCLPVRVDKLQVIRLPYFSPYTSVIHQADH